MIAVYLETARTALRRALKAWPVAFSLVLYGIVIAGAAMLLAPLGLVGGLLLGLVAAACASGYLHLLSQTVSGAKLDLRDLKQGFRVMFWDVISVMFAIWILSLAAALLTRGAGPKAPALAAIIGLAMAFFFNPVPELVYQGRSRSFQLLLEAGRFVLANPVAWFLPNVLFAAALLAPTGALTVDHPGELILVFGSIFSPTGVLRTFARLPLWSAPLVLLFLHYVMVFRGVLFQELTSGGARRRAWQAKLR